jgi:hypothetical protein
MKLLNFFISLGLLILVTNCDDDSGNNSNSQFLLDIPVNETINLNFPQFNQLQFPSNAVFLANAGNGGIIITNTGSGFVAFDAADPNRTFEPCSILEINGVIGQSTCENAIRYSLFTGLPLDDSDERLSTLIPYRVEQNGSTLRIFN